MSTLMAEAGKLESPRTEKAQAKREAIKAAATELLLEFGYENTSLDLICERASCSKSAIYEFFGNKQGLLAALTEDVAVGLSQALHAFHRQELSVRETLLLYSELAQARILDEKHIAVVRATIASLGKFPELGPTYYRVGAQTAQVALAQYFSVQIEAGKLLLDDPEWAAHEFQGLLFWERLVAQVVGAKRAPGEQEIRDHARKVVDTFLKRYEVDDA